MWNKLEKEVKGRDLAVKREAEEHLMKMEEGDNCKPNGIQRRRRRAGGSGAATYFHIFRGEGQLATKTAARSDYGPKGRGDRFPDKKHAEAGECCVFEMSKYYRI
ncbi:hypothetical protein niasHS_008023 [Heterodera schachtii]|uniref:Uncharacterized protein n=1 Tax=Heterodera schachtii TaxID=97005 RepID=A0ABD2J2N4_HETSC